MSGPSTPLRVNPFSARINIMRDFLVFLGRFLKRVTNLSGAPALVGSRPVQFVWYSPPLRFARQGFIPLVIIGLLALGIGLPVSPFDKAKRLVASRPDDFKSHLSLAGAAAGEDDFELAEREYAKASQIMNQLDKNEVLGITSEFEDVRKIVFPEETVREEIAELEATLEDQPGYRDLLLRLAVLYWQVYDEPQSQAYFEEARNLDPNNEIVKEVGELLSQ